MNVLKIRLGEEVRRVTPLPTSFAELCAVSSGYFDVQQATFAYENDRREQITVADEESFTAAQNFCQLTGEKVLRLDVIPELSSSSLMSKLTLSAESFRLSQTLQNEIEFDATRTPGQFTGPPS
jgi:hypothetical protein